MTNTTSGRPIDPRFDPAFQPGYDPQSDPTRAARGPSYDAAVDSPRLQAGRVVEPPRAHYAADVAAPAMASHAADADVRVMNAGASPGVVAHGGLLDSAGPPSRNPFLIALWAVGSGFVLCGVLLTSLARDLSAALMSSTSPNNDYIFVQIAANCVPAAFTLGFGTIIGLLFVHARRWAART